MLLLYTFTVQAQSDITKLEYFIDEDPGVDNGTDIAFSQGQTVDIQHSIDIPSLALSNGIHLLVIRAQNLDGEWSFYEARSFFISEAVGNPIPPVADVVALEYYIDDDPGEGGGTDISITPGAEIDIQHSIDISSLALDPGYHKIGIRAQNANGDWSMYEIRKFLISEAVGNPVPVVSDIVAAEYFIDTDPGQGSGTSIPVSTGATVDTDHIITAGLDEGWHTVNVRSQNAEGQWGFSEKRRFYVKEAVDNTPLVSDVVQIEYFFNDDPGIGQATPSAVGPGQEIDIASLIIDSQETLPVGTNTFNVRAQNADGLWGFTEVRDFEVQDDCTQPVADFDIELACAGEAVAFTDNSADLQLDATYKWYLDGEELTDETSASFNMIFDNPGEYMMSMAVRQGQICLDSIGEIFTVKEKPIVVFSADPAVLGDPTMYEVESFYVDGAAIWAWDFESDATVDDNTVGDNSHTFGSLGTYSTTLSVTDGLGCNATFTKDVEVVTEGVVTTNSPNLSFSVSNKIYGDPNFELSSSTESSGTISYSSSDENVISISGTTATVVGAGPCIITALQIADGGYDEEERASNVVVNKKALFGFVDDASMTYGESVPVLTISYEDFVDGDDESVLTEMPVLSTTADETSPVGSYDIEATAGSDESYEIVTVDGTLAVEKADLTVTADDQTRMYRFDNPKLTMTYTGFVNDEGDDEILSPSIFTTATKESPEGTYDIFLNGGSADNYNLMLVNGTFTIIPSDVLEVSSADIGLQVYPNPVTQNVSVNLDKAIEKVMVINTEGRLMLEKEDDFENIDLKQFPSGIYLLKVFSSDQILNHKIIKK